MERPISGRFNASIKEEILKMRSDLDYGMERLKRIEELVVYGEDILVSRMHVLEVRQNQDDAKLAAQARQIRQISKDLSPFISLGEGIKSTPGGLRTWLVGGVVAAIVVLTGLDLFVRTTKLDTLVKGIVEQLSE